MYTYIHKRKLVKCQGERDKTDEPNAMGNTKQTSEKLLLLYNNVRVS